MATVTQIKKTYIDHVLTHGKAPDSVYLFAKKLKITESEFYQSFASFTAIERSIWADLMLEAITQVKAGEEWRTFSAREKMLSFFYSFTEWLKTQRSFVIYTLNNKPSRLAAPSALAEVKPLFESFSEDIVLEGLDSGELADRKFFSKRYKDALWLQYILILDFWKNDDSPGFEKTDEAIEKGINVTFDLFQRSPLDQLFEYGKFITRNSKLRQKTGL